jgi:hypothetical protein
MPLAQSRTFLQSGLVAELVEALIVGRPPVVAS